MADPALEKDRDTPGFKVLIGGAELPAEIALDVLEVEVSHAVEGADVFTVAFNNWSSEDQEFKYFDSDLLRPGAEVEVRAGYVDDLETLIEGEVTALEPEFHVDGMPTLKVRGYDRLHRFRRGRRTRTFVDVKDSDVAARVARELGLRPEVEDTEVVHEYVLQDNRSDIDFLLERARRIRYELIIRDGTLFFRAQANDEAEVVTLRYGFTLQSFYPCLNTLRQVSRVVVRGWDPKTKEPISAEAGRGDETTTMGGAELGVTATEQAFFETTSTLVHEPVFSTGEAAQIARGKFNDLTLEYVTGEALAIGEPRLRAGSVVELDGLGARFSGNYYVTTSCHRVSPDGYTTRFQVERNAA